MNTSNRVYDHDLPPGRVSVPTAAELMGINYALASKLVTAGVIPSTIGRNSVTGLAHRTVAIEDIEAFDAGYISLFALASQMGVDPKFAKAVMCKRDVLPELKPPIVPATFYRRQSVACYLN